MTSESDDNMEHIAPRPCLAKAVREPRRDFDVCPYCDRIVSESEIEFMSELEFEQGICKKCYDVGLRPWE